MSKRRALNLSAAVLAGLFTIWDIQHGNTVWAISNGIICSVLVFFGLTKIQGEK